MNDSLNIVIFGLSVTSSWGNGHATTYRGLMQGLHDLGHQVRFIERDLPWYESNRDLAKSRFGRVHLYKSVAGMKKRFRRAVANADVVIVGSYVPEGIAVGEWVTRVAKGVTAFYDIDTPVTLAKLEQNTCDYVSRSLIPRYSLYLSFTGGPTLRHIEKQYAAKSAQPLYCSVDPGLYSPQQCAKKWDLGYMGTYSADRQAALEELMLSAARISGTSRMVVAGAQYPRDEVWPENIEAIEHVAPAKHAQFYGSQRFTLNLTRAEMKRAGYSPSVRLFEAAACGTPIISDEWRGLEAFFRPGRDILVSSNTKQTLEYLHDMPEIERLAIAANGRERVLRAHTSLHRAKELEDLIGVITTRSVRMAESADSKQISLKVAGPGD
jgi:spore maturation protein CgeB